MPNPISYPPLALISFFTLKEVKLMTKCKPNFLYSIRGHFHSNLQKNLMNEIEIQRLYQITNVGARVCWRLTHNRTHKFITRQNGSSSREKMHQWEVRPPPSSIQHQYFHIQCQVHVINKNKIRYHLKSNFTNLTLKITQWCCLWITL